MDAPATPATVPRDGTADGVRGVLFLVVGPSGVGKDTLIDAAKIRLGEDPAFVFARRVVTRPADAGGESHEPMEAAEFAAAEAAGAFAVTWRAHGLAYGVRTQVLEALAAGTNVVVNASRRAVGAFRARAGGVVVLSVTAPPQVLRARLAARGREDAAAVAARLARDVAVDGADTVIEIVNDQDVATGAERFVAALLGTATLPLNLARAPLALGGEPLCLVHRDARVVRACQLGDADRVEVRGPRTTVRARLALARQERIVPRDTLALSDDAFGQLGLAEGARVTVRRAPRPESRDILRRKVAGEALCADDIARVVRDLVDGRYAPEEIAGFLVAASTNLSLDEVVALTRARAEHVPRFDWGGRLVADKHSTGGVPGGRISMIVVPILVAHGLLVPKTSSRAITSAAGTADVMECAARVDLSPAELGAAVEAAGGAVAWSGRINHGPIDDVMNAINRPLGIRSAKLDVSSILSKKLAVGATHVMIDIPVGPRAKTRTRAEGAALAELFETVGRGLGLRVQAVVTDGSRPIGQGVGPALELADVRAVLTGATDAPRPLRAKALDFAGAMLEWDGAVRPGTGRGRAEALLASGAAADAFARIVDAQGRAAPVAPGVFRHTVRAERGGVVASIDGFAVAGLARAAGAPGDKGAGARVLAEVGQRVEAGEPLLDIFASTAGGIDGLGPVDPTGVFSIG